MTFLSSIVVIGNTSRVELCINYFSLLMNNFRFWTSSESDIRVQILEAINKSTHIVYLGSSLKLSIVQSPCHTRDFHYNQSWLQLFSINWERDFTTQSILKETSAQVILQETSTQSHLRETSLIKHTGKTLHCSINLARDFLYFKQIVY